MKAAWAAVVLMLGSGCNPSPKPHGSEAPATSASAHTDEEGDVHSSQVRPPVPTVTALSAAARAELTALRVSAHQGSVIIRKGETGWVLAGPQGCTVAQARIELALDNLSALQAVSTTERPADGSVFELQIVAESGDERTLHFDIAGRQDGRDLLQLPNEATYRLQGLDRKLWSPDPRAWCALTQ